MMKSIPGLLAIALSLGASTSMMHAANPHEGIGTSIFVLTNDNTKNEVLAYQQENGGQFVLRDRVDTGGRGSGGTTDPLQSQGSLTLSGDHTMLFAVNAASGKIGRAHV